MENNQIDRWAQVAMEWKAETAEFEGKEPWLNWDASGRKGYGVVVVELLVVGDGDND